MFWANVSTLMPEVSQGASEKELPQPEPVDGRVTEAFSASNGRASEVSGSTTSEVVFAGLRENILFYRFFKIKLFYMFISAI